MVKPELNIGMVGHIDHGKTTLTHALSGKWTDTYSEELKRGITIKLGYANVEIRKYKDKETGEIKYTTSKLGPNGESTELVRVVSIVDAPGHEALMATMLSGATIMDAAILVIAANEKCPQPQTEEHLMALEAMGLKNIIIVQNKIDLVSKERALENYKEIKEFVKGTIAENAPIIPVSAQQKINIDLLLEAIQEFFPTPKRDLTKNPIFYIARTFDVNKPGTSIENLVGGVIGGALKQGVIKEGDLIEIRPGLKKELKKGQIVWEPIVTKVTAIYSGEKRIKEATPGGSVALSTTLDPSITKSDGLLGNVIGLPGKLPETKMDITFEYHLLKRLVNKKDELITQPLQKGEILLIHINNIPTVGYITNIKDNKITLKLKYPIVGEKGDKLAISRRKGNRWRLIGYGELV
jgi:translation initiation factor 2 subunit 3